MYECVPAPLWLLVDLPAKSASPVQSPVSHSTCMPALPFLAPRLHLPVCLLFPRSVPPCQFLSPKAQPLWLVIACSLSTSCFLSSHHPTQNNALLNTCAKEALTGQAQLFLPFKGRGSSPLGRFVRLEDVRVVVSVGGGGGSEAMDSRSGARLWGELVGCERSADAGAGEWTRCAEGWGLSGRAQDTAFLKGFGIFLQCWNYLWGRRLRRQWCPSAAAHMPLCLPAFCSGTGQTRSSESHWPILMGRIFPSCLGLNSHSPEKSASDCALRAWEGTACWSVGWSGGSQGCGPRLGVHMLIQWWHPGWEESHASHPAKQETTAAHTSGRTQHQHFFEDLPRDSITLCNSYTLSDLILTTTQGITTVTLIL